MRTNYNNLIPLIYSGIKTKKPYLSPLNGKQTCEPSIFDYKHFIQQSQEKKYSNLTFFSRHVTSERAQILWIEILNSLAFKAFNRKVVRYMY